MTAGASVNIKLAYVMFWGREGGRGSGAPNIIIIIKYLSLWAPKRKCLIILQDGIFAMRRHWQAWLVLILQPSGPAVSVLSDGARLVLTNRKWIIVISATPSWPLDCSSVFVKTTSLAQAWHASLAPRSTFPINPSLAAQSEM